MSKRDKEKLTGNLLNARVVHNSVTKRTKTEGSTLQAHAKSPSGGRIINIIGLRTDRMDSEFAITAAHEMGHVIETELGVTPAVAQAMAEWEDNAPSLTINELKENFRASELAFINLDKYSGDDFIVDVLAPEHVAWLSSGKEWFAEQVARYYAGHISKQDVGNLAPVYERIIKAIRSFFTRVKKIYKTKYKVHPEVKKLMDDVILNKAPKSAVFWSNPNDINTELNESINDRVFSEDNNIKNTFVFDASHKPTEAEVKRLGFKTDNPGGEWLANKREMRKKRLEERGYYYGDSVTGYFRNMSIELPVSNLLGLDGANNEHQRLGLTGEMDNRVHALAYDMAKNGYDASQPIMIGVMFDGTAQIMEGNHRLCAAYLAGINKIPVDVRYFDGSEQLKPSEMKDSKMSRDNVLNMALAVENIENTEPDGTGEGFLNEHPLDTYEQTASEEDTVNQDVIDEVVSEFYSTPIKNTKKVLDINEPLYSAYDTREVNERMFEPETKADSDWVKAHKRAYSYFSIDEDGHILNRIQSEIDSLITAEISNMGYDAVRVKGNVFETVPLDPSLYQTDKAIFSYDDIYDIVANTNGAYGKNGEMEVVYDAYNHEVKLDSKEVDTIASTNMAHLNALADAIGAKIKFFENPDENIRGFYYKGEIWVNTKAKYGMEWALWHEMTHAMKAKFPELYKEMVGALGITEEQVRFEMKKLGARGQLMSTDDIIEEAVADAFANLSERNGFWNSIEDSNPGLIARIIKAIKELFGIYQNSIENRPELRESAILPAQQEIISSWVSYIENASGVMLDNGTSVVRKNSDVTFDTLEDGIELTVNDSETGDPVSHFKIVNYDGQTGEKVFRAELDNTDTDVKRQLNGDRFEKSFRALADLASNEGYHAFAVSGNPSEFDYDSISKSVLKIAKDYDELFGVKPDMFQMDITENEEVRTVDVVGMLVNQKMRMKIAEDLPKFSMDYNKLAKDINKKALKYGATIAPKVDTNKDDSSRTPVEREDDKRRKQRGLRHPLPTADKPKTRLSDFIEYSDQRTNPLELGTKGGYEWLQAQFYNHLADGYTEMFDEHYSFRILMDLVSDRYFAEEGHQDEKYLPNDLAVYFHARTAKGSIKETERINGKFHDILKKIPYKKQKDFEEYLVALRGLDYYNHGLNPGLPNNRAKLQEIVDRNDESFKKEAQALFDIYNKAVQETLVDTGIISEKNFKIMREKWPHYVPFIRDVEDEATIDAFIKGNKRKVAEIGNPVKKATGTTNETKILNPLEVMVRNMAVFQALKARNETVKTLVNISKMEGFDWVAKQLVKPSESDRTKFTMWENGEKAVYETDPMIFQAIRTLENDDAAKNMAIEAMSTVAEMFKKGTTRWNPSFIVRNFLRDPFEVQRNSQMPVWVPPFCHTVKGLFMQFSKDPKFTNLIDEAIKSGVFYSGVTEQIERFGPSGIRKSYSHSPIAEGSVSSVSRALGTPFAKIGNLNTAIEIAPKLTEYEYLTRKLNMPEKQAATLAREVNVDFQRHGSSSKKINRVVPFFDPQLQSIDKMRRALTSTKDGNNPIKAWTKMLMFVTLPSMILWALNHDDDEYKEMPQYIKDYFWVAKIFGTWVKLPKPFEMGVLFGSGVERLLSNMYETDPDAFKDFKGTVINSIMPSIIPTALSPFVELFANKDLYFKTPIVPPSYQKLPLAQQKNYNTSLLAAKTGDIFGISPMMVDHFIRSWTGTVGMEVVKAGDIFSGKQAPEKRLTELPMLRSLSYTPGTSYESVNRYYDYYNDLEKKHFGKIATPQEETVYKKFTSTRRRLSELWKKRNKIMENERLSPERKRELLDNTMKAIARIAESANKVYYRIQQD